MNKVAFMIKTDAIMARLNCKNLREEERVSCSFQMRFGLKEQKKT